MKRYGFFQTIYSTKPVRVIEADEIRREGRQVHFVVFGDGKRPELVATATLKSGCIVTDLAADKTGEVS